MDEIPDGPGAITEVLCVVSGTMPFLGGDSVVFGVEDRDICHLLCHDVAENTRAVS